ncbi:MAG: phenylacetic acid degradation protein [Xanthomonadales bacterium]|nr:phenylacetic acid degradation protein [Xanthomonadales bacterium]
MTKFHKLHVAEVLPETRDAIVVKLKPSEQLIDHYVYRAGQHLTFKVDIGGQEIRRSYSICSAVQERVLRVAIKKVDDGLFSNWAFENLKPGASVEVMEPQGNFNVPLQPDQARHHVAFASGSGITPILSLIKTTLLGEPKSRVTLVYGNRASSSVMFKNELEDLKDLFMTRLTLVFVLSREQQDVDLFNGRIDGEKCRQLLKRWVDPNTIDVAYICGPQSMMEQVQEHLLNEGLTRGQIKLELFAAAMHKGPQPERKHVINGTKGCSVTIVHHGLKRDFEMGKNKESLLDAAIEEGIELPYSCKGGVCGTCRAKLLKGEVDMDANYALEDYEVARGFILACQSFPITDSLTVDLDQET